MAHTFTSLLTHVVFSTSERRPFLSEAMRPDAHAYMVEFSGNCVPFRSPLAERRITFTC